MRDKNLLLSTKGRLAKAYFPFISPEAAVNKLRETMQDNIELMDELRATGYQKLKKTFTPKQLQIIFKHLGAPFTNNNK